MTEQQTHAFERHPAYDGQPASTTYGGTPPTHSTGSHGAGTLLGIVGAVVAVLTVVGAYVVMRWMSDPLGWFVAGTGLALLVLAVLALVAGRRGGLATYVAIALLLPFLTTLSALAGLGERVEDSLAALFGDGDSSASFSWDDTEGETESVPDDTVALGEEGTTEGFTVVVSGVECTTTLPEAADNPDWITVDDAPQYVDAKAPKGKQFCVVSSTWSNTTQEPQMVNLWGSFSTVATAEGTQYAPSDDDSGYSMRLTDRAGYEGGAVNPGDAVEVRSVFTVPEGTEVTHAVVEGFGFDAPSTWFALS